MQTSKQQYKEFLSHNFNGMRLRQPLFYTWNLGLRFDLQVGDIGTDKYFKEVVRRSSIIFETAFDKSDRLLFVLIDYKYKRRKIRFGNFAFKQIHNLKREEVSYLIEKKLYQSDGNFDVAIVKLTAHRINHKCILTAIGNSDFPPRLPRLDNRGLSSKELYFLNLDKKLIFHMYDDRGLDIIATDKEILASIYAKHKDWILDCDRKQIDKQFEGNSNFTEELPLP